MECPGRGKHRRCRSARPHRRASAELERRTRGGGRDSDSDRASSDVETTNVRVKLITENGPKPGKLG